MVEFLIAFGLGAVCAVAVCWYLWKSTDAERASLKAKIQRLEDDISSRFKSS